MSNLIFHKDFTLNGKQFDNYEKLIGYTSTFSEAITSFLTDWFNEELYITVKTSGSTGNPKDIKLQKQYMINSAAATGIFFNLPSTTTALLCLSADYIAGKMMLVRALTLGWHIDVVEPSINPLGEIDKEYDFSAMVPLQVFNSFSKLEKVKKLIIGGGVVSKDLEAKLQNISTACFATYGMTETITHIAVKQLNSFNNVTSLNINSVERSHYKVLPDVKISTDKRGCLVINAPKVADELIITNDLVTIQSETDFKWLGRYDNIINSGGVKLIPELIESKLSAVINSRFFVAGIPDKVLGEKLILIIEKNVTSSNSDDIENCAEKSSVHNKIKHLKTLSKFEIPKEIYFLPKFIETDTKKIQRKKTLDLIF